MRSDGSDLSRPSFIHSNPDQVPPIRFIDTIVSSLGTELRDRSCEDDEDTILMEGGGTLIVLKNDEETHVGIPSGIVMEIREEDEAGPSRTSAMESIAGLSRVPTMVSHRRRQSMPQTDGTETPA